MYSLTSFYLKKKISNPVLVFVLFFVLLVVLFYSQELFGLATKKNQTKWLEKRNLLIVPLFVKVHIYVLQSREI